MGLGPADALAEPCSSRANASPPSPLLQLLKGSKGTAAKTAAKPAPAKKAAAPVKKAAAPKPRPASRPGTERSGGAGYRQYSGELSSGPQRVVWEPAMGLRRPLVVAGGGGSSILWVKQPFRSPAAFARPPGHRDGLGQSIGQGRSRSRGACSLAALHGRRPPPPLPSRPPTAGDALWLPNTERPAWLDGSLPGDRGFDPLGLAKPVEYLQFDVSTRPAPSTILRSGRRRTPARGSSIYPPARSRQLQLPMCAAAVRAAAPQPAQLAPPAAAAAAARPRLLTSPPPLFGHPSPYPFCHLCRWTSWTRTRR